MCGAKLRLMRVRVCVRDREVRENLKWLRESSELPAAQKSLRAIQQASSGVLRELDALTRALSCGISVSAPVTDGIVNVHSDSDEGSGKGCVGGLQKALQLARSVSTSSTEFSDDDETDASSPCGDVVADLEERSEVLVLPVQSCFGNGSGEG